MSKKILKHIVFLKLIEDDSSIKEDQLTVLKEKLNALTIYINEIIHLEVGVNFSTRPSAYDLALVVHLADEEALDKYRIHPKHIEVLDYMKDLNLQTSVVDYYM